MISESEWTKNQREFVGSTFPTPKGGIVTVVGVHSKRSNGAARFAIKCSICSEDEELFPLGALKASKKDLLDGKTSCGCSNSYAYSPKQYDIKLKRFSCNNEYKYVKQIGNFKGDRTKIELYNPVTKSTWKSSDIRHYLRGKTGDPSLKLDKIAMNSRKDDAVLIKEFIKSGAFHERTVFCRDIDESNRSTRHFKYKCPLCSEDDYVKAGICNGIFSAAIASLKKGMLACRCNKSYKWNEKEMELKLSNVLKIHNSEFNNFVGKYKNLSCEFEWTCTYGHKNKSLIGNFLYTKPKSEEFNRCKTCLKDYRKTIAGFYGWYPERAEEEDNLYVIIFDNKYFKVGRAFNIDDRIGKGGKRGLIKSSGVGFDKLKIVTTYRGRHEDIYKLETTCHNYLYSLGLSHKESTWTTETFEMEALPLAIDYLNTNHTPQ